MYVYMIYKMKTHHYQVTPNASWRTFNFSLCRLALVFHGHNLFHSKTWYNLFAIFLLTGRHLSGLLWDFFSRNDSINIIVQHFICNIYALSQNKCSVCHYEIVELMIKWILLAKIYLPSYRNVNNCLFSFISVEIFKGYDRRFRFYY